MERRAVGSATCGAREGLSNRTLQLPSQGSVSRLSIALWLDDVEPSSSHNDARTNFDMLLRRALRALAAGVLMCGAASLAQAQSASPKAAKSTAKPDAAKPTAAATGGAEPTLIGQFGTWGAYAATPNGKKVCFALAKPSSSKTNPPNRPRDPAYAFVSTRPAEKVTNEVSVMIGYTLKPGSESTLEVGGAAYSMYTQGDGLWIKNAAEEERMVEAMRKSADATVKGVSAKGTETTDIFSLKGLSQALDKIAQDCRR
jgi:hypothetical protein